MSSCKSHIDNGDNCSLKCRYICTFEICRLVLLASPVLQNSDHLLWFKYEMPPTGSCVGQLVLSWWGYFGEFLEM